MTIIEQHDGHDVVGTRMSLGNVGDGLSKAMKLSPQKFRNGDRVTVIVDAIVTETGYVPVTKDDYDGPEFLKVRLRGEGAFITENAAVGKLIDKHRKELNKANEIAGQQSIEDDLNSDEV